MCIKQLGLLAVSLTVAASAGASSGLPEFDKWANKNLVSAGITDARVVQTYYPRWFSFCRGEDGGLWRYTVMDADQMWAMKQGHTVKPLSTAERLSLLEANSAQCGNDMERRQ